MRAKVIDGGDIKLTRERFESPWRPFKSLTETAMMALCRAHMPSHRFLWSLWKVLKLKHKRQDGTFERFNPDDLPESPDHYVTDAWRGLPLIKAYEYPVAAKAKNGSTTTSSSWHSGSAISCKGNSFIIPFLARDYTRTTLRRRL